MIGGCVHTGTARVKGLSGIRPDDVGREYGPFKSGSMSGEKGALLGATHVNADGDETVATWECEPGCPVAALDAQSGVSKAKGHWPKNRGRGSEIAGASGHKGQVDLDERHAEVGGASRMFPAFDWSAEQSDPILATLDVPFRYVTKAARREKEAGTAPREGQKRGNTHPTPKPIALMKWLIALVTPLDGVVLDPFAGSGSTGCAAVSMGVRFAGIEREAEYIEIAKARIAYWASRPEGGR